MGAPVLYERDYANGSRMFQWWCPGCRCLHLVCTASPTGSFPVWGWNSDMEKPTFTPSILTRPGDEKACHVFINDGVIDFLGDCWHDLKGQKVPMEPIPLSHMPHTVEG